MYLLLIGALWLLGLVLIIFSSWVTVLDTALGRLTFAFVEDLQEAGRKGATAVGEALTYRRDSTKSLVGRSLVGALGLLLVFSSTVAGLLLVPLPIEFSLLLSAVIALLAQGLVVAATSQLLVGERYVWVALRGAPLAKRLYSKQREEDALQAAQEDAAQDRLAVAQELHELVDEVSEGETPQLDEEDMEILKSVFELGQTRVGELMVPRAMMVTVPFDTTAQDVVGIFMQSGFSRLPVVGKTLDDILGTVYLKDVVRRVSGAEDPGELTAADMMRPASFVPEMKLADDELRVMQANNTHLALVVDEYGGIAGLVTAEDILEELVGELTDEHDRPGLIPWEISPGVWRVPASFSLADLEDLLDVKVDEDTVYSVGGLLAKQLGKVPLPGDCVEYGGIKLEAGDDVGRRKQIQSVSVEVVEDPVAARKEVVDE